MKRRIGLISDVPPVISPSAPSLPCCFMRRFRRIAACRSNVGQRGIFKNRCKEFCMRRNGKSSLIWVCVLVLSLLLAFGTTAMAAKAKPAKAAQADPADAWQANPKASFDASKMSDMSDFDPANPIIPTGDTIRVGIATPFSGRRRRSNGEMVGWSMKLDRPRYQQAGRHFLSTAKKKEDPG